MTNKSAASAEHNTVTGPELYARLALLDLVADHRALSVDFGALALTGDHIRAAAPWGAMRVLADLGLDGEACVDATRFINMLVTVPDAPFTATVNDNALHWTCGPARGRLGLIGAKVPVPDYQGDLSPLARDFGVGLELGAAACGHSPIFRRAGLEGVQLRNRGGKAYATARDGVALSSCCLGAALPMPEDQIVTIKPEAAALLAEIVQRELGEMFVGVDEASLYVLAPGTEITINQLAPLAKNLAESLAPFIGQEITVPLMHERVVPFLKLVEILARERGEAMVEIGVTEGQVTLAFHGQFSSTSWYYDIVPEGPRISVAPTHIEARRLAPVLAHAKSLVFDYTDQNIVQLWGDREFVFIVSGRSER